MAYCPIMNESKPNSFLIFLMNKEKIEMVSMNLRFIQQLLNHDLELCA